MTYSLTKCNIVPCDDYSDLPSNHCTRMSCIDNCTKWKWLRDKFATKKAGYFAPILCDPPPKQGKRMHVPKMKTPDRIADKVKTAGVSPAFPGQVFDNRIANQAYTSDGVKVPHYYQQHEINPPGHDKQVELDREWI